MSSVYIIKSTGAEWYYVGSTKNVEQRLRQHNNGEVRSSKSHQPLILVYREEFANIEQARAREREIKDKRKLKEEIIRALSSNG